MEAYGGVDVKIHIFLTLALAGGEWSASRPGRFASQYAPLLFSISFLRFSIVEFDTGKINGFALSIISVDGLQSLNTKSESHQLL
jgi:hypothetical protein